MKEPVKSQFVFRVGDKESNRIALARLKLKMIESKAVSHESK